MACGGCDSSTGLNKDQVENLITKLIRDNTLQGGLNLCNGRPLPAGSSVLTCDGLVAAIKEHVANGDLPFVTDLLPNGSILTWKVNGENKSLDLAPLIESAFPFGNTIKKGILAPGLFDVDLGNIAGKGLEKSEDGKLNVKNQDIIDNDSIIVDPVTGKLKIANKAPIKVTSLNDIRGLGTTNFYGNVCNTNGSTLFVVGVPQNNSESNIGELTPQALTFSELAADQCYDFNGWQVASEGEVHQYFMDGNKTWVRSQDAGMNPDGTHKGSVWSQWKRTDNVPAPQDGINELMQRLNNIESALNDTCTANVKTLTSNYTPTKTDEMLIFSGGQTVTFDGDVPVGKQWTIINDSDNALTLASSVEIIPPYKGSLKVKGKNAVVTVVKTTSNQFRVFGQTEA